MRGSTLVVTCYLCCGKPRLDCPRCHGSGQDPGSPFTSESALLAGFNRVIGLVRR